MPDVPRFDLIDQEGNTFDSAKLHGRVYAVSFFFAGCPTICRDLQEQIRRVNDQLRKQDVTFVSISVDPEEDTPEKLNRYAQDFGAKADRWAFLTDQPYKVRQLGEQVFRVVVDKATHTDNILLVDKWGRYRDRFKWDDPYDMKRFVKVAKELEQETEMPLEATVRTRNAMAGIEPSDWNSVPWIREFHLTERSGEPFFSRQMTGQVWIASFFFTTCPGICKEQNEYLRGLQQRWAECPTLVSITTNPNTDTIETLRGYARDFDADKKKWLFCTGDEKLIPRIGAEFFKAHASGGHHSSRFYVVDKWGVVRGDFDWQKPEDVVAMKKLAAELEAETTLPVPQPKKKRIRLPEDELDEDEDDLEESEEATDSSSGSAQGNDQ